MTLDRNQIAHQFSRAATTYDNASGLQNRLASYLIQRLPPTNGGRLVDLGCGTGWALQRMAESTRLRNCHLIGVDLAPGMIDVARQRIPTAEFYCADLEQTPLASHSAEIVFSSSAIQWCDTSNAIDECQRVCAPGGSLLLSTFGPATLKEIREAWSLVDASEARVHPFASLESLRSAVHQAGFSIQESKSETASPKFASVGKLLRSVKTIGATHASGSRPTGLLGRSKYQRFCQALKETSFREGSYQLTFECLFLIATKPV